MARRVSAVTRLEREPAQASGERAATVSAVEGDALELTHASGERRAARRGLVVGWSPRVGDRVLTARVDDEDWIVAVLLAGAPPTLVGPDGSRATLTDQGLELCDAAGRLLARTSRAGTTLEAPAGDLVLRAPAGRVRIEAGLDVELGAARDVITTASRDKLDRARRNLELSAGRDEPQLRLSPKATELSGEALSLRGRSLELAADALSLVARTLASKALETKHDAGRWEVSAGTSVERARESFREVVGLAHTRVGRAKTLVSELFSVRAKRSELTSEDDTVIDGRKVLLG
jgi:hypothetical protein